MALKSSGKLLIVGLVLYMLQALAGANLQAAESISINGLPPKIEQGIQYVASSADKLTYTLQIDREQLPESMRKFSQLGRDIAYVLTDHSEQYLEPQFKGIKPAPYTGITGIGFPAVPGERFIMTVLFDDSGNPLGYATQCIKIGGPFPFSDLGADHWAFLYINDLTERGWLEGYSDGTFQPDRVVTRAEFAKLMVIAAGLKTGEVQVPSFEDISPSDWYTTYVEAAMPYLTTYLQPNGNIAYRPNEPVSRETVALGLMKLKGDRGSSKPTTLEATFTDAGVISSGAKAYVAAAVEQQLISGYPDNTFRPAESVTRAQVAKMLYQAYPVFQMQKVVPEEKTGDPAVPKKKQIPLTNLLVTSASDIKRIKEVPYYNMKDIVVDIQGQSEPFELTYSLNENFERIQLYFAVAPSLTGDSDGVKFEVLGDGKTLFVTGVVRVDKEWSSNVELKGVQQLKIRISSDSTGNSGVSAIIRRALLNPVVAK